MSTTQQSLEVAQQQSLDAAQSTQASTTRNVHVYPSAMSKGELRDAIVYSEDRQFRRQCAAEFELRVYREGLMAAQEIVARVLA